MRMTISKRTTAGILQALACAVALKRLPSLGAGIRGNPVIDTVLQQQRSRQGHTGTLPEPNQRSNGAGGLFRDVLGQLQFAGDVCRGVLARSAVQPRHRQRSRLNPVGSPICAGRHLYVHLDKGRSDRENRLLGRVVLERRSLCLRGRVPVDIYDSCAHADCTGGTLSAACTGAGARSRTPADAHARAGEHQRVRQLQHRSPSRRLSRPLHGQLLGRYVLPRPRFAAPCES
jgi:hypothetical protein